MNYSLNKRKSFIDGFKDGIPIGLGYFAVSFSLGILAKQAGLSALQGFVASITNLTSAGEYAAFSLIAVAASLVEVGLMTFIANARYMLMSTALSQKLDPDMPFFHRLFMAYGVTDEIFAISINQEGYLSPYYMYGAFAIAIPGWSFGTAFGVLAGNIMPLRLVSALSVALYGMFLACIIPKAREDRVVLVTIIICFILSYLFSILPGISSVSAGTRTIILTVVIAAACALLFPRGDELYE